MTTTINHLGANSPELHVSSEQPISLADLYDLVGRAEEGCKKAITLLGRILDHASGLSTAIEEICRLIELRLIDLASGDSRLQRIAHTRFIMKTRHALLAGSDSPMELFLVHRIVASNLNCTLRRIAVATPANADETLHREMLLERANLHQIECIATFRDFRIARLQRHLEEVALHPDQGEGPGTQSDEVDRSQFFESVSSNE